MTSSLGNEDVDDDDIFTSEGESKPATKAIAAKESRIPKTWFFDSFVVDGSGKSTLTKAVPSEITSWAMTGFSLDRNQGLAIADPKTLYVKKEFFIKLDAPTSVRMGEVLKLEVFVYNYLPTAQNSAVTVTLRKPDDFEDYSDEPSENSGGSSEYDIVEKFSKCDFRVIEDGRKSKVLTSNPNAATSTFFLVRPRTAGVMKLKIAAVSTEARDEIETRVLVEYEGVTTLESHSFLINPSQGYRSLDINLPDNANINSVKVGGSLHYKLLGKSLLNVEKLM